MKSQALSYLAVALLAGCSIASDTISSAGHTAAGGVKFAGKTAASATGGATRTATGAVGSAGDVAVSTMKAAGEVVMATGDAVVGVIKAPFVTVKNTKTGKCHKVEWERGMTLHQALDQSKLVADGGKARIRRGHHVLKAEDNSKLKPGDVIEFCPVTPKEDLAQAGAI
ncbi:MAG TPA: hypothetical protein VHH73_06345 [Verrucomicrobiae bacterium]|nr:hypothetical protein [Verrucomicrobiae bacterium]